ncbi:hypothetical protein A2Y83_04335 [Candidatus Falkowbacteria bacterium RBG_13_39_14]|uniref:Glycosyltransferase subfamily 4-like N-terminal domain-containing protein n=1 Tax=Candidatus Falkowbacteria bacterium RBG_13_39_14 TaxID=1797985 RepID=A0A1F5S486_9BACT|nr:MAG: hypothetical protein A2Y83_04335 [Candidatus Falkowbacteria bacterium RBG_13_39_14]
MFRIYNFEFRISFFMAIKKVLYIVTQSEWGGAQKYVYDLTKSFLDEGMEAGVAAGTEKADLLNKLASLESDKLSLFREKHMIRAINPYHDAIEFFSLIRIICKFKPDIVHLNSSKAGMLGTAAAWVYNLLKNPPFRQNGGQVSLPAQAGPFKKGGNIKVIYTAHGFVFNENLSILIYLFYLWLEKVCSWMRDKVIAVSLYDMKSALEKKAVGKNKITVVHNGVDLKKRDEILGKVEARGKLKNFISPLEGGKGGVNAGIGAVNSNFSGNALESPEAQIVGTVANFYENKGLKYLIEAAGEVVADMPNAAFILIGKGELEHKLRKIVKDKRLADKFFIIGAIPDAYKYFRAFDVFCLPSIKEGLSYTLLEALMAGLPIVSTEVGGNPEIVGDGDNGFLVLPKDKSALAEKIKSILKNKELREKMGESSYQKAGDFSLEKMVRETREVYDELFYPV